MPFYLTHTSIIISTLSRPFPPLSAVPRSIIVGIGLALTVRCMFCSKTSVAKNGAFNMTQHMLGGSGLDVLVRKDRRKKKKGAKSSKSSKGKKSKRGTKDKNPV